MVDMHREILDRAEAAERKLAMAREALEKAELTIRTLEPRHSYMVTGDHGFDGFLKLEDVEHAKEECLSALAAIDAKNGE